MAGRTTAASGPVASLYDFFVMALERGITIRDGERMLTVSLGSGAAAEPETSAPAAKGPGKRRGRKPRTAAAPAPAPAAKRGRRGRKPGAAKAAASRKRGSPVEVEDILKVLRNADGPMDRKAIAKALGIKYQKLIRRMNVLEDSGQVKKEGSAYMLP